MNNSIGDFLQLIRKEKGLTQKELAEKINVSDKTISKWENGNSTPDTMILTSLCKALDISVNELLSGEKLPPENYSQKAEENMVNLLYRNQAQHKATRLQYIIGGILAVLSIVMSLGTLKTGITMYLDFASFILPVCMCLAATLLCGRRNPEGVIAVMKASIIPSGVITSIMGLISLLSNTADMDSLGPKLAICLLTLLYSTVVYLILYVIGQHIKK